MYINADFVHKSPPSLGACLGETRRPKGLLDPRLDEAGWLGGPPPTLIHLWTPPPLVVATRRCAFRDTSQYFRILCIQEPSIQEPGTAFMRIMGLPVPARRRSDLLIHGRSLTPTRLNLDHNDNVVSLRLSITQGRRSRRLAGS